MKNIGKDTCIPITNSFKLAHNSITESVSKSCRDSIYDSLCIYLSYYVGISAWFIVKKIKL